MQKTILFIAGSIETVPAVQRAKEMGLHTVVSDGSPTAACFEYAHDFFVADTYDVDATVTKAMHYHRNVRPIDGVICVASDVPLTVASVANALNLQGIPISAAQLASDKLAMKTKFANDGVPIPWFKQIMSADDLVRLSAKDDRQLIIKPADSRGARGVIRILPGLSLVDAFETARSFSPTNRVMVEEYIEGPQVSTESIVLNGRLFTPGFADRNYDRIEKYAPYMIEDGGDLPSALPSEIQEKTNALVAEAAKSMGINHGVVKGDIVIHNDTPMIIELAARLSGGYFCTHEIPLSTGVDFVGAAIRLALNEAIKEEELNPRFSKYICQRYLFPKPGTVTDILGVEDVRNRNEIAFCDIRVQPGSIVRPISNHPARAGMVIAYGNSRSDARKNAEKAISDIRIEVS
ncbi:MAG: ATP-grasp domain-containing protein [Deltaproteobacteria bacterium]|nr:ATP-grasp domain-containing protein [Deltaproteobacteria bacterium]